MTHGGSCWHRYRTVLCVLTLAGAAAPLTAIAQERPNVVLILADDLGYNDISLHGNTRVRTPKIDTIGRAGVWFTRGHTTAPVCAPSRAGLMTGRNQQRFGFEFVPGPAQLFINLGGGPDAMRRNGAIVPDPPPGGRTPPAQQGIPRSQQNLAEFLKTQGYATGIFGKWHLGTGPDYIPPNRGFDEHLWAGGAKFGPEGDPDYVEARLPWSTIDQAVWRMMSFGINDGTRRITPDEDMTTFQARKAVAFIEAHQDEPFFLYLPFFAPHNPIQAPRRYYDRLEHIADHKTRVYYAMIECLDDAVGLVTDTLDRLGLDDNTIVIFTSDNGAASYTRIPDTNQPFRGAKLNYYQGGVVVPYLMKWPDRLAPGTVFHRAVSQMDVFPTIAAAIDAPLPPGDDIVDGVNLLPYLLGERTGAPREGLVWRSGRYKAVLWGDYRLQIDENQNRTVLYDVTRDIGERHDLAATRPETVDLLRGVLGRAESQFVEPMWLTPFYTPRAVDIWPGDPPAGALRMYFGG